MKVLESFLIALGIKVDEKSFQKADAAFGGLTKTALQFGAVLAGKLAIDKVVGDFKNVGTELNNFNKLTGMSTQNVQSLGQALKAQGGNASDAFSAMLKMQDLMASPITGDTGWFGEVAKLGLNPDAIIGAQDTAAALANIAGEFEHMTDLNQRLAGKALGLDDSTVRLLMRGRAEVEKQLDSRGKLAVMTQQQIEDAARLTKATSELDQVFSDIGNTIAGELAPAFAEMAEDFVAFYRDNKELVDSGLKEFFGGLADNIELVSVAIALLGGSAALKGLATLRAIVGLGKPVPPVIPPASPTTAIPLIARVAAPLAALLYSSKLNEGEDTDLVNNKLKKGGNEAAGATIDYLRTKGISEVVAAGIAANIQKESKFNSKAVGDNGQAYGLLQWHPPRQADFAKYTGKDIKASTETEQLDFLVHEIKKGNEKGNFKKVELAQTPYEAGDSFSRYVVRPAAEEKEAKERGDLAESYGRPSTESPASTAPEISADDLFRLSRGYNKTEKPQEGFLDQTKTWLDDYRKSHSQAPDRSAPREYDVNSVVPATKEPAAPAAAAPQAAAVQPSYTDSRVYHISGADTEKVKQVLSEQMSKMTEQTMQDFRSPEQ